LLIHEQENGSGEKILVAFDSASAGPSDAIEGYVPQGEQRRLHLQLPADKSVSKSPKKKVCPTLLIDFWQWQCVCVREKLVKV
jgi:hypothetical protein